MHHHAVSGRRVRPRPVNFNERLPVVRLYGGEEELDPNLEAFLEAQEEEQAVLRALEEGPKPATKGGKKQAAAAAASIAVPQIRMVADYKSVNEAALKPGGGTRRYNEIDPVTTAYIRSQEDVFAPQTMEQVLMAYDMDDEDELWLAKHNAKVAKSSKQPATVLSPVEFETLVARLEVLMQEAVSQESVGWQAEVKAHRVPGPLPAPERLLSRGNAAAQVRERGGTWDQATVLAVYDHWLARRRQVGGPLLSSLWFQQPWKAISFESEEDPGYLGDMPFMALETRNSRGNRLRMTADEALDVLFGLRGELEQLRTLADQVRKRERLKKHLLKIWRAQVLKQPIDVSSLPPLLPAKFLRPQQGASKKGPRRSPAASAAQGKATQTVVPAAARRAAAATAAVVTTVAKHDGKEPVKLGRDKRAAAREGCHLPAPAAPSAAAARAKGPRHPPAPEPPPPAPKPLRRKKASALPSNKAVFKDDVEAEDASLEAEDDDDGDDEADEALHTGVSPRSRARGRGSASRNWTSSEEEEKQAVPPLTRKGRDLGGLSGSARRRGIGAGRRDAPKEDAEPGPRHRGGTAPGSRGAGGPRGRRARPEGEEKEEAAGKSSKGQQRGKKGVPASKPERDEEGEEEELWQDAWGEEGADDEAANSDFEDAWDHEEDAWVPSPLAHRSLRHPRHQVEAERDGVVRGGKGGSTRTAGGAVGAAAANGASSAGGMGRAVTAVSTWASQLVRRALDRSHSSPRAHEGAKTATAKAGSPPGKAGGISPSKKRQASASKTAAAGSGRHASVREPSPHPKRKRVFDGLALPSELPVTGRRAATVKPVSYLDDGNEDDFDERLPWPEVHLPAAAAASKSGGGKAVASLGGKGASEKKAPLSLKVVGGKKGAASGSGGAVEGKGEAIPPEAFGWGGRRVSGTRPRGRPKG